MLAALAGPAFLMKSVQNLGAIVGGLAEQKAS
jgi:hypothetical protein